VAQLKVSQIIALAYGILLLLGTVWLLFRLMFGLEKHKTALLVGMFTLLFFSYGHVYHVVEDWRIGIFDNQTNSWIVDWTFGTHSYLGALFALIFVVGLILITRIKLKLNELSRTLVYVGLVLVLFPVFTVAKFNFTHRSYDIGDISVNVDRRGQQVTAEDKPDIYYILLDGYGREDILKKLYGYDNGGFVNSLKGMGFYVADKATSNYMQTDLSLSSTFNYKYLNYLRDEVSPSDPDQRGPYISQFTRNKVWKFMKQDGYTWVTFATAIDKFSMPETTDLLLGKQQGDDRELFDAFLNTTPMGYLFSDSNSEISPYKAHEDRIHYTLNKIKDIHKIKEPTFTFAHILSPHPPFVFDHDGNPVNRNESYNYGDGSHFRGSTEEYQHGYSEQIQHLNKLVLDAVRTILEESDKPPIIIVQGDHGPGSMLDYTSMENTNLEERMSILDAYYFPDQNYSKLYQTISPINSFPIILNQFFGTNLELQEDRSYYAPWSMPLDFTEYKH
jgi:hypothetical protein